MVNTGPQDSPTSGRGETESGERVGTERLSNSVRETSHGRTTVTCR